jgi:hypothetical protein
VFYSPFKKRNERPLIHRLDFDALPTTFFLKGKKKLGKKAGNGQGHGFS